MWILCPFSCLTFNISSLSLSLFLSFSRVFSATKQRVRVSKTLKFLQLTGHTCSYADRFGSHKKFTILVIKPGSTSLLPSWLELSCFKVRSAETSTEATPTKVTRINATLLKPHHFDPIPAIGFLTPHHSFLSLQKSTNSPTPHPKNS